MNLLDILQSASNAAASNVSGPVDMLSWGLRKIGVPVGDAPVGGSEWMRRKGLTRDVQPGAAQLTGETLGLLSPIVAAAKAPQIARGLLAIGDAMPSASAAGRSLALNQDGKIVWHGSPHEFNKFDASKIGTGEGAQAYGHGLYVAESPKVAASYRDALTPGGKHTLIDGQFAKYDMSGPGGSASSPEAVIQNKALFALKRAQDFNRAIASTSDPEVIKAISALKDRVTWVPSGNLYKIDLPDEHIAKILDYDTAVPEEVRGKLSAAMLERFGSGASSSSGKQLYEQLAWEFKNQGSKTPRADASAFLRQQGIPGIRYLDGGSRGAGAGTSNYVVFPGNENLLTILERNGVPIK